MATLRIVYDDQVISVPEMTDEDLTGAVLAIADEFQIRGGYWFSGVDQAQRASLRWVPARAAVYAEFDGDEIPERLNHLARK